VLRFCAEEDLVLIADEVYQVRPLVGYLGSTPGCKRLALTFEWSSSGLG
jgi:hypothetical protein